MQAARTASDTWIAFIRTLLMAAPLFAAPLGCSSFNTMTPVHQSAKGSVVLEEVTDWSFEASHPTMIDATTIAKALRGVQRDDAQPASSKMSVGGGSKPMRVFSDEDIEFLAPLLAQALSHAKPEQIVGFSASSSAGSGSEPTTGTLYAQRTSLYLTLTRYQGKPAKSSSSWFARQTADGKAGRISFYPAAIGRTEPAQSAISQGQSNTSTVVIDQMALARIGAPSPVFAKAMSAAQPMARTVSMSMEEQRPSSPSTASSQTQDIQDTEFLNQKLEELRKAKEAIGKKDTEIGMLRKESTWMKRELKERDAEIKGLKKMKTPSKPAPKKKTATVHARPQ